MLLIDFPDTSIDDYIHRIGRTGRAGATGHAETLFTVKDKRYVKELIRILREAEQEVPPELEALVSMSWALSKDEALWDELGI